MSDSSKTAVTIDDVIRASRRISPHIHRTPVLTCEAINRLAGCQLFFKCENLQKSGSFKIRGAMNAVAQLARDQRSSGVVTHSSGNHAAALAMAAKTFDTIAHIVMPSNSAEVKKSAVKHYGGQIVECPPTLEARLSYCDDLKSRTGATLIPPFDHPHIIAGQGTCALEFHQQVPDLDTILAPIGGGGLMSGTCIATKAKSPRITIIGGEPSGADDAYQSKQQNRFVPQTNPQTIADGLRTSLGEWTWPYIRDEVSEIITVDDPTIAKVMKFFWERTKQIIEPSCAVPLAAVTENKSHAAFKGKKVGIIISGGNVDLANLPWL